MNQAAAIDPAENAMYLYYLATAIIQQTPALFYSNELRNEGEDGFVMDLFPFAQVLLDQINKVYYEGKRWWCVMAYDICDPLAQWFWDTVETQLHHQPNVFKMPDLADFQLEVIRLIDQRIIKD